MGSAWIPVAVVAAAALMILVSVFGRAGRIASSLRPFVHRQVRVTAWGQALPASPATQQIDSIRAVGAGLLVFLKASPAGKRTLLKVAQPGDPRVDGGRAEIGTAAYVQWNGRRIPRAAGAPALTMEISA